MGNHSCTPFEAAAAWEYRRAPFDEPILILDLDTASAGVCEPASGGLPKEIWHWQPEVPAAPFFRSAALHLFPDCADPDAVSDALYEKSPQWSRTLRTYLLGSSEDFPLEPICVSGQTLSLNCSDLVDFFDTHYRADMEACLSHAHSRRASDTMRILPVGTLARFYPAEHLIRQQFYSRIQLRLPVLPGLVHWNSTDDPSQIISQGTQLHRQIAASQQILPNTWSLQILHRKGDRLVPVLLPLAEKGLPLDALKQVTYCTPILAIHHEPLSVYADSTLYQVQLPATVFSDRSKPELIQVGLGLLQEVPALYIRCGNRTVRICPEDNTYMEEPT